MPIVKYNKKALATKAPKKGLKLKQVMVLDLGDGAFTDKSVKVRPHKTDANRVVFKCVSLKRLKKALADAGIRVAQIVKGKKHFIAFIGVAEYQAALSAGNSGQKLLS